jgi:hypothetical protein
VVPPVKTSLFASGLTSDLSLGPHSLACPGQVEFPVSQQALFVVTRVTGVFLRELKISSDVTLGESEKIIKKNSVSEKR